MKNIFAFNKVQKTIIKKYRNRNNWKSGKLKGGTVILIDYFAAYYVKNDIVYAANGQAKALSPGIEYINDEDINYDTIKKAVKL